MPRSSKGSPKAHRYESLQQEDGTSDDPEIGRVGAGKTALLHSILGELVKVEGQVAPWQST